MDILRAKSLKCLKITHYFYANKTMSIKLKETLYMPQHFETFANVLQDVLPNFDRKRFFSLIFNSAWEKKELKERMRQTTFVLHSVLGLNFERAADKIVEITKQIIDKKLLEGSFVQMSLAEYVQLFGLDYFEKSMQTIEEVTKLASCEFAIRPFIKKYEKKTMQQMLAWSKHQHPNVRRLASEGCRPMLPWAEALPKFKADPSPILPILENLKNDNSKFVQKSVANNLNDISKNQPEIVLSLAKQWIGKSKNTDWIVKHACRTLLKAGNKQAIKLFGYSLPENVKIDNFTIKNTTVELGKNLYFSFNLQNLSHKPEKIRVEYALYFLRANGTYSKKVFKINENIYKQSDKILIEKKHSFKPRTTRKYYIGTQKISIIINGEELQTKEFDLIKS